MMSTKKLDEGKLGEEFAVEFLRKKGFKIIDRNFRIRGGEVDIIATDPSAGSGQVALVFVEVKTRISTEFGTPLEAIGYWKLKSLIKTAEFYKLKHPKLPDLLRIDAVSIILSPENGVLSIELVKNIS